MFSLPVDVYGVQSQCLDDQKDRGLAKTRSLGHAICMAAEYNQVLSTLCSLRHKFYQALSFSGCNIEKLRLPENEPRR